MTEMSGVPQDNPGESEGGPSGYSPLTSTIYEKIDNHERILLRRTWKSPKVSDG
jgi:hypothetical protein